MFAQPTPAPSPGRILAEEFDPAARLNAHLELGRRALATDDLTGAETHFTEACELDPTDERARAELRGLGKLKKQRKSWWRW